MADTRTRIASLALVVALVLSALAVPAAMAASVDTSTTDTTTTQSELTSGSTQSYNATTSTVLQVNTTTTDPRIELRENASGDLLATYTSGDLTEVATSASGNHYNLSLADDGSDYWGLAADPGEAVDLNVTIYDNDSDASAGSTSIQFTFDNGANQTLLSAGSDDTETAEPSLFTRAFSAVPYLGSDNTTNPAQVTRTVNVSGEDQDRILLSVSDADAQDALDAATPDDGVTYGAYAQLGDEFVPVISAASDAPDWLDTDEQAYVTVADAGSQVTIANAGDLIGSDATEIDLSLAGSETLNVGQVADMLGNYGASTLTTYTTAFTNGEFVGTVSDQFAE